MGGRQATVEGLALGEGDEVMNATFWLGVCPELDRLSPCHVEDVVCESFALPRAGLSARVKP